MQAALLPPSERQCLSFSEFFAALLQALVREGLRPCVLRNYEGFPDLNVGNDIDFLIYPSELPGAMRALRSIEGVRVVGYVERPSVALVYLEGISPAPGVRALEVDFDLSLDWKGLPFLTTDAVLQAAIPRIAGNSTFYVPSPVHEAIISLFASLLVGGWLKEKYFPKVQRTFASDRSKVIAAILPQFGLKSATRLVDSVISGDRRKVQSCIRSLRVSLATRSLLCSPIRVILEVARHYTSELAVRHSSKTLETVCLLGQSEASKTKILDPLVPLLRFSAVNVEKGPLRPWLSPGIWSKGITSSENSSVEAPSGSFVSMAKIVLWLAEEWLNQFKGRKNLTLRICDGYFHDLFIASQGYRYGGSVWFARLVGKLFPSPDLWILLDTPTEVMLSRNQELPSAEALRQLEAYRVFVKTRKRYVILDASQPAGHVTERAYAAIIDTLAQRADREIKRRF